MPRKEFITRLSKYGSVLTRLSSLGLSRVFSDNLGEAAGISSSQVRKDLSSLKITGNKRGGYNIEFLEKELNEVLGKNEEQKVIIVGCGNIARALVNSKGFQKGSLKIVAGFDIDPDSVERDPKVSIPVHSLDELEGYIQKNGIKVGVIAVPDSAAAEIHERMTNAGIKGVLNFAHVHLREKEGCVCDNIDIDLKIENLFYFVNFLEKETT